MGAKSRHIAIIQGHPDPKGNHYGHALAEAYSKGAIEGGHEVDVIPVAKLDFPLLRSKEEYEREAPPETIRQVQSVIMRSHHVVMIYPLWNGAMPAVLKAFLEQTFRPAFVFPDLKPGKPIGFFSSFTQRKALKGKTARIIVTMQMAAFVYRWYFRPHPEKNTLRLSGIGRITENLIGLVDTSNGRKREQWLGKIYALGREGR